MYYLCVICIYEIQVIYLFLFLFYRKRGVIMKHNIAYKFRIYPNKIQRELISKTFGCVRFGRDSRQGILWLQDHQGCKALYRPFRIHPLHHSQTVGICVFTDSTHRCVPRSTAKILSHHRCRSATNCRF